MEIVNAVTESKTDKDLIAGKSPQQVAYETWHGIIPNRGKIRQAVEALDLTPMGELKGQELVAKIDGELDFWPKRLLKTTDWAKTADELYLLSGHIARVDNFEERARLTSKYQLLVESQPMLVAWLAAKDAARSAAKTTLAEVEASRPIDKVGIIKQFLGVITFMIDEHKKTLRLPAANQLLRVQELIELFEDASERTLLMENHRDVVNSLGPEWNELYAKLVAPSGKVDESSYDRLLLLPEFKFC